MTWERRIAGLELRAEGRRLSGVVMRYGDISPSHRERFEPGALRMADAVHLDLHHDPERAVAWHPGGGLALDNTRQALTMRAELPPIPAADRALAEIRAGRVGGLSVEFRAERERRDGDIRVIEAATLSGIGIVRAPSYGDATVEARAKRGARLMFRLPADKNLACRCCGPERRLARYTAELLQGALDRSFEKLILFDEDYARPLASATRGTLRRTGPLDIEADLPTGPAGDAVVAAHDAAGVIVRPFVDPGTSKIEVVGNVAVYTEFELRSLIASATDAREGWPEAVLEAASKADDLASASAPRRRPAWL